MVVLAQKFEDLEVWTLAKEICVFSYGICKDRLSPLRRDFGFRSQLQRASVSILSNIAEGFESRTTAVFIDFIGRAKGSAGEVRSLLHIAHAIGYLDDAAYHDLISGIRRCSRMLHCLMESLRHRR